MCSVEHLFTEKPSVAKMKSVLRKVVKLYTISKIVQINEFYTDFFLALVSVGAVEPVLKSWVW